jgi:hypothetical protein
VIFAARNRKDHNVMRSLTLAALASLSLAAAACGPKLAPPPSFASIDGADYDYRATTPQGVVVAVRKEPNDPRADLEFWSRAVDLRLKRDGYARATEAKVKTDRGLDGVEMSYARQNEGRTYRYEVAVFVDGKKLYLVEAGGDAEDFDPARNDVERAIRSLKP